MVYKLFPHIERPIWSGNRLASKYNKPVDGQIGECWELSVFEGKECTVQTSNGRVTLTQLLLDNPDYTNNGVELLFKLIDTDGLLSVQVHPDDAYAIARENSLGKTEAWYVLDADADSYIYYGLNADYSTDELRAALTEGSILSLLNKYYVKRGDRFFIESGTVHALGKGITIAEIQESSNITYRLYDYNRTDKDGKPRQLHIERGLDVISKTVEYETATNDDCEEIFTCPYFNTYRILAESRSIRADDYAIVTAISGSCTLYDENSTVELRCGETAFIPRGVCVDTLGDALLLINSPSIVELS